MIVLGMLFACQEVKDADSASSDTENVEYYEAQTWVTLESMGSTFDEQYLVRRTLDVDNAVILEEFYSLIDGTATSVTLTVDIQNASFTMLNSVDDSQGEGTFEGDGLDWSAWDYHVQHSDGTFEIAENYKDADGIHSSRVGYGMDNRAEWTLDEILSPMDAADWQNAFDELPN